MVDLTSPRADHVVHSPPQSPFRPSLPPIPAFKLLPPITSRVTPVREFHPVEPTKYKEDQPETQELPENNETDIHSDEAQSHQEKESEIAEALSHISREISEEEEEADRASAVVEGIRPGMQSFARVLIWLCISGALYAGYSYKLESAPIGYCDRGSNTSAALQMVLTRRAAIEACARDGKSFIEMTSSNDFPSVHSKLGEPCPLPPLIPIPHPNSCTKCPDHATCGQFSVACDSGYLLKPNILLSFIPVSRSQSILSNSHAPHLSQSFFKAASDVTSGLPGFGSVGLTPRCVEDPRIGALGKAIGSMLAKERGRRICRGDYFNESKIQDGPEDAVKWGTEVGRLKEVFKSGASVRSFSPLVV